MSTVIEKEKKAWLSGFNFSSNNPPAAMCLQAVLQLNCSSALSVPSCKSFQALLPGHTLAGHQLASVFLDVTHTNATLQKWAPRERAC